MKKNDLKTKPEITDERAMPLCGMGGPNGMQFVRPVSTGKGDKYASMLSDPKK